MPKVLGASRFFAIFAVGALLLPSLNAQANIIEVEAATGCPGSVGGGLCNGRVPFNLNTLLSGGISITISAEKFVVTDTTGSFSFVYTGSSGDNGSCQIKGAQNPSLGARSEPPVGPTTSDPVSLDWS